LNFADDMTAGENAQVDLLLSCPDGRHVGMNYETGLYESQVDGAVYSGDNNGAPEWIYVPDVPANADCTHYVSSYRVQQWLDAHPDVATQLPTTTETYELYARVIDPAAGILTSATVAGAIEPGEEVSYAISVAEDGTPTVAPVPTEGTFTLTPSADTYLRDGFPNQNQGAEGMLRVRALGDNRALVQFGQEAIAAALPPGAQVTGAALEFTITGNGDNWGRTGRTVDVHRITRAWTELAATWNCAVDANPANHRDDCFGATAWEMGRPDRPGLHPWVAAPTATATITNGLAGVVTYDVTADVNAFLAGTANYGWLVRKTDEGAAGLVEFGSRESAASPRLTVTWRPP
jgi:hypothetical protein